MNQRQNSTMFGMNTINDYLAFCAQAVAEFKQDQGNVLRAFGAILAINHIPDWLQYKLTSAQRQTFGITCLKSGHPVKDHFEGQSGDVMLVRQIANGFKHLTPNPRNQVVSGYGCGPSGVGPYGASYLLVDLGQEVQSVDRWVVALDLCRRTLDWWNCQLAAVSPSHGEHGHE